MQDPNYDVVRRPWFGPRRRAKQLLQRRTNLVSPAEFVQRLKLHLRQDFKFVQRLRFYDFTSTNDGFHYSIALVWTDSDHSTRENIHSSGEEIVKATGWYPLIQGAFLESCESMKEFTATEFPEIKLDFLSKQIIGISSATIDDNGGCSIRIHLDRESILLDTGFPRSISISPKDRLAFVSHTHLDHSGGIEDLCNRKVPVFGSFGTTYLLAQMNRLSSSEASVLPIQNSLAVNKYIKISPFPVPHMPGASGLIVEDPQTAIIYTGDICLKTARHDFTAELGKTIKAASKRKKVHLLLDATMASRRKGGASRVCSVDDFFEPNAPQDIILTAKTPDHLVTAYLDIFHKSKSGENRGQCTFLVGRSVRPLFKAMHSAFIRREFENLDPFIIAQYGKTMSSWAESCWL